MSCKVVVSNLNYRTTWHALKDHMRQAGEVVHANVMLEDGGRSKGWGLVTYADPTSASAAIDLLNDSELEGRTISVRPDRDAGGGGGGGHGLGGLPAPTLAACAGEWLSAEARLEDVLKRRKGAALRAVGLARQIVLHLNNATGNAGARIACGVITAP